MSNVVIKTITAGKIAAGRNRFNQDGQVSHGPTPLRIGDMIKAPEWMVTRQQQC
jgi:hypothetical protein